MPNHFKKESDMTCDDSTYLFPLWKNRLLLKYRQEAVNAGCELVGTGKHRLRGVYRLSCGHKIETFVNRVRNNDVPCTICNKIESFKRVGKMHDLEMIALVSETHAIFSFDCGHTAERSWMSLYKSQRCGNKAKCSECVPEKLRQEAVDAGIEILNNKVFSRDGKRQYRLACGHSSMLYPQNVRRGKGIVCYTCEQAKRDRRIREERIRRERHVYLQFSWNAKRLSKRPFTRVVFKACKNCDEMIVEPILGSGSGRKTFCSKKCSRRYCRVNSGRPRSKRFRKRVKNKERFDAGISALRLSNRDGWECQICGEKVVKHPGGYKSNGATVGHIVALSEGGLHVWENCHCECHECNISKGVRSQGQFGLPLISGL